MRSEAGGPGAPLIDAWGKNLQLTFPAYDVAPSMGEAQCGRSGARKVRSEVRAPQDIKGEAWAGC